ncbi:hypothetical protein B0H12DRAFT_1235251 [Mycena haematopus]|nr:hypothetical protein B0H12DRAFT_1235251 [Mycena haematopus]
MFSLTKFCVSLALLGAVAAISDLQVPSTVTSGGPISITWLSDASDTSPVTVVLFSENPGFPGPFAVANNVNPQDNKVEFTLPQVTPGGSFTIGLSSLNDPSKVLVSSGEFSIGAPGYGYGTTTTKSAPVTSSHVGISTKSTKSASATHSASGSASHSVSGSAVHSGSTASHSTVASLTIPFPSASASSHPILSFTSAAPSLSAITTSTHASTPPGASASAHPGSALSISVPALGLTVAIGGLLMGAWAL